MSKRSLKLKNKVYKIVSKIPEGKVLTYKKVAEMAGFPKAWRAVGNILNKNTDFNIPCHRVIRSGGKIGGYNKGVNKKILLLKKEGVIINNLSLTKKIGEKTR
jgi:methylated-DNA-[protein]-cysteine S-methyltransferase